LAAKKESRCQWLRKYYHRGLKSENGFSAHEKVDVLAQGKPRVPKMETPIDPINPRGELAELALAQNENQALRA